VTRTVVPVVAALAVVAVVALAPAPAASAHPPVPLCGGCTDGFEAAAADHDANASVEYSTLELQFHENETATGVASVRVDEQAAARFRENAALLDAVATDAFDGAPSASGSWRTSEAVVRNATRVDASIVERTVTVTFVLPAAGLAGVDGVVYTDLFRRNATVGGIELQVNETTIEGPANASLVRAPADWRGDAIRLGAVDGPRFVGYGGYVAWAPTDGPAGTVGAELAAFASIWAGEAATELPAVATVAWPGSALAVVVAGLLALAGDRVARSLGAVTDPRTLAVGYGVATVGCLAVAVLAVVSLRADWLGFAFLGGAPGAVLAAGATAVLAVVDAEARALLARVPTAVCYALPVLGVLAVAGAVAAPGTAALLVTTASVFLFGALGAASTRGAAPTAAVAATLALAPLTFAFPSLSASAFGSPSPAAWLVVVAVLGAPLFALGRRGATANARTPEHPPGADDATASSAP
jgi:hypothetical protein